VPTESVATPQTELTLQRKSSSCQFQLWHQTNNKELEAQLQQVCVCAASTTRIAGEWTNGMFSLVNAPRSGLGTIETQIIVVRVWSSAGQADCTNNWVNKSAALRALYSATIAQI
jgi:hypothetical protein